MMTLMSTATKVITMPAPLTRQKQAQYSMLHAMVSFAVHVVSVCFDAVAVVSESHDVRGHMGLSFIITP